MRSFFQWGSYFCGIGLAAVLVVSVASACPPSLWGVFVFRGRGCFRVCLPPVGYAARLSGVFWGSPYQRKAAYFYRAPIGRFSTPPVGGCSFFVDCGSAGALIFVVWESAIGAGVPSYRQSMP